MIKNQPHLVMIWEPHAWDEYVSYLKIDKKYLKRINKLIKSIYRDGHRKGFGQPEPLKNIKIPNGMEAWSKRITKEYRLVYYVKPPYFKIISCRYHY